MARFSREEFLEYYDFQDEPELVPAYFHNKYKAYEKLCEEVPKLIKDTGIKVNDALAYFGINKHTYYSWKSAYLKELRDGKTDTPLIRLYKACERGDADLKAAVGKIAMEKIYKEGDGETMRFVMKHRLGYNEKKEVELSTAEDTSFNINIVESKPRDD